MEKVRTLSAPEGTGSILCCALSPHGSRTALALGGEEAAACVVDLRVGGAGGDASSSSTSSVAHSLRAGLGCFHADDAVTSVTWHPTREHVLLCAHGRVVTAWDVRHLPSETAGSADSAAAAVAGMSLAAGAAPRGRVHLYAFNNDEVNSVCVDRKGRRMCAADDGGEIVVVDVGDETSVGGALVKTLKNGHENIAAGAAFRDHKPNDVVSGGLDCAVCKWDQSRATPVATWRVGELASASDAESGSYHDDADDAASPPPMCNPPMVHAIACANGFEVRDDCAGVKRLVAAACGDGTCALIDLDLPKSGAAKSRNNKSGSRTSKGRSSSSSAAAAAGAAGAAGEAGGTSRGSASAGNDPFATRGGRQRRAAVFLGRSGGGGLNAGHSGSCNSVAFAGWSGGALVLTGGNDRHVGVWDWRECGGGGEVGGEGGVGARVRFFRHGRKVNWVCAASALDNPGGFGDTFVADTGEKVAAYALSL